MISFIAGLVVGIAFGMVLVSVLVSSKVEELEKENYELRTKYKK